MVKMMTLSVPQRNYIAFSTCNILKSLQDNVHSSTLFGGFHLQLWTSIDVDSSSCSSFFLPAGQANLGRTLEVFDQRDYAFPEAKWEGTCRKKSRTVSRI